MRSILLVFIVLMFTAVDQHSLYGQYPSDKDTLITRQINEVTVSALMSSKLNFPHIILPASQLQYQSFATPADALSTQPGVQLVKDGAWGTSVNIRGMAEPKLLFMADGDRMLTASDLAGVISTVDMSSLQSIEIVKGAGSILYGSGAMGGVVNFVPYRPGYRESVTAEGLAGTGFQTVNHLWHSNVRADVMSKEWYITIDGSFRTAGNITSPIGQIPNSQFNDAAWGIRGGIRQTQDQELLFSYHHFEAWNAGLPGGNAFPPTAEARYMQFVRNQFSGEYIFSNLSDLFRELKIKAYTQNISREVENVVSPALVIFPGSLNVTSGVRTSADLYFNAYSTLTLGAEAWVRDQKTHRVRINMAADTIFTGEQPTPYANMMNAGVFAHHRWDIDPQYWSLNTGLRIDFIQTYNDSAFREVFKYKTSNGVKTDMDHNRTLLFAERTTGEMAYALHADLAYRPSKAHQWMFSLANAYRVATMEERFKYIDQAGKLSVGNPDLKPEKGVFTNFGYAFAGRSLRFKADFFANYVFDLIAEQPRNFTLPGGLTVPAWVMTNIDEALYLGGEMEIRWNISPVWSLAGHAAYVNAQNITTGTSLPFIPPLNGKVLLDYHLMNKLTASLVVNWQYHLDEAEAVLPESFSRFAIVDLHFFTEQRPLFYGKVIFSGGVKNLMNTSYREYLSSLRGINRLEPGRNLYVKATYHW